MKTRNIFEKGLATLLCAAVFAGFAACSTDPVEREGGKLPDKEAIESTYGMLRSNASTDNTVDVLLTVGAGFVTRDFYYQQTKPAAAGTTLTLRVDESLVASYNAANAEERTLLPSGNYEFPDGETLELAAEGQRSAAKRVRILAEGLNAGEYVLPVTVAAEGSTDENQTLYYTLTVRDPQPGDNELHDGSDFFFVFYVNTSKYQPLIAQDYLLSKTDMMGNSIWYNTIGNIINLRIVTIKYDAVTGRAKLDLGSDMTYVLDHAVKYIWPLQEVGRKVCISIEGGGTGMGFCNLSDEQIDDFVAQVKFVVETYNLDGVNLWDRNAGYGKEGMPETNTTSYPKLVKAMRDALGTEKLLTLTVYEEPTSTFWDTEATGGIAVGDYLDYAWSGYNENAAEPQLLDPWHPDESYVSAYTQKPIAGLDSSHFGCLNLAWVGAQDNSEYGNSLMNLMLWVMNSYRPNNILVFEDLRTNLQDDYEGLWDMNLAMALLILDPGSMLYDMMNGCMYNFDNGPIADLGGTSNYGKWLKDWD